MAEQHLTDNERELILKFAANPLDFFSGETRGWLEDFIHLSGGTGVGTGGGTHTVGHLAWICKDLTAQTAEYVYEDDSGQYLYLNGVEVSQTTYADLFAFYGANAYGTDASGNFFLPDTRGRAPFCCGTHANTDLGDNDGVALASRQANHIHGSSLSLTGAPALTGTPGLTGAPSITDPGHAHDMWESGGGGSFGPTTNANEGASHESVLSNVTGITVGIGTLAATAGSLAVNAGDLAVSGSVGSGMSGDAPAHIFLGSLVVRF